jgi:hypothetical protein
VIFHPREESEKVLGKVVNQRVAQKTSEEAQSRLFVGRRPRKLNSKSLFSRSRGTCSSSYRSVFVSHKKMESHSAQEEGEGKARGIGENWQLMDGAAELSV